MDVKEATNSETQVLYNQLNQAAQKIFTIQALPPVLISQSGSPCFCNLDLKLQKSKQAFVLCETSYLPGIEERRLVQGDSERSYNDQLKQKTQQ